MFEIIAEAESRIIQRYTKIHISISTKRTWKRSNVGLAFKNLLTRKYSVGSLMKI